MSEHPEKVVLIKNNENSKELSMDQISRLKADELRKYYSNLIDVLRYHLATGRFSYVDRIMSAMDSSVIEETVREAIRVAISASSSLRVAEGHPIVYNEESNKWEAKSEKIIKVTYCEEERLEAGKPAPTRSRLHGRLVQVNNEWKIFYIPPRLPSESELASFFDAIRNNLNIAKLIASLAMTLPFEKGGEG
jgi:CRISPR type I-A-associated protein Csa5